MNEGYLLKMYDQDYPEDLLKMKMNDEDYSQDSLYDQ